MNVLPQKCGMVAVLGEANAGKSTLLNALTGEKVSIVCHKPHTTRYDIYGIICKEESQIILIDTPGIIDTPHNNVQHFMKSVTTRATREADVYVIVIDVQRKNKIEKMISQLPAHTPKLIVLNKVDLIEKQKLLPLAQHYSQFSPYSIPMVSSKYKKGLEGLMRDLVSVIPVGPWLFPHDEWTQISQRFWAAEITREKLFHGVHQEIPYHTHVTTTEWKETEAHIVMKQDIVVDRDKYKKWIIGFQGRRLQSIGEASRRELTKLLHKPVHLYCTVVVDEHWAQGMRQQTMI